MGAYPCTAHQTNTLRPTQARFWLPRSQSALRDVGTDEFLQHAITQLEAHFHSPYVEVTQMPGARFVLEADVVLPMSFDRARAEAEKLEEASREELSVVFGRGISVDQVVNVRVTRAAHKYYVARALLTASVEYGGHNRPFVFARWLVDQERADEGAGDAAREGEAWVGGGSLGAAQEPEYASSDDDEGSNAASDYNRDMHMDDDDEEEGSDDNGGGADVFDQVCRDDAALLARLPDDGATDWQPRTYVYANLPASARRRLEARTDSHLQSKKVCCLHHGLP